MFDCLAQQALPHVVDIPAVRACSVVQHKPFDGREANRPDLLSNHDILKAGVAVSTVQKSIEPEAGIWVRQRAYSNADQRR